MNQKKILQLCKNERTFVAIWLLGALCFSWRLTSYGLWEDEGYTYFLAHMPLAETWRAASSYYLSPPLWYLFNKPVLWLFGNAYWSVRLLSLIASLGSLVLVYRLLCRWSSRATAQIAALLFACSPMAMSYAQSARDYAFIALVYLMAAYLIDRWVVTRRLLLLFLAAAAQLALLYLHSYGPILWVTLNLFFVVTILFSPSKKLWRSWLFAQLMVLVLFAPRLLTLFQQLHQAQENSFLLAIWQQYHGFKALWYSLRNFIPGASLIAFPPIPGYWSKSWLCLLPLLLLLPAMRSDLKRLAVFWRLLLLWLLPLLLILLYSYVLSPVYVVGRTEAIVLPCFCGWLALLLSRVPWRSAKFGLVGFMLAVGMHLFWSFHYDSAYANLRRTEDHRTAAAVEASAGEAVILVNDVSSAVAAHLFSDGFKLPVLVFPDIEGSNNFNRWQSWPNRVLELKSRKSPSDAELDQAFTNLDLFLQQLGVHRLTFVCVFREYEGKKIVQHPYTMLLMQHLDKLGYRPALKVLSFPIDNMTGSHAVLNLFKSTP